MKPLLFLGTVFTLVVAQPHLRAAAPFESGPAYADSLTADSIVARLTRIALKNPAIARQEATASAALYDYKATRTDWLDNFRASGNLNEFTIKGRDPNLPYGANLYPRYNVGLTLPLGIFVNQGKRTKAQYYRYQAEQENLEVQKQNLHLQVAALYYDYLRNLRLIALQEEVLQDAEFAYQKAEEEFSKNKITLDMYTASSKRYNAEQVQKVTLERDLAVSRIELETVIGMPLNQALARVRTGKP